MFDLDTLCSVNGDAPGAVRVGYVTGSGRCGLYRGGEHVADVAPASDKDRPAVPSGPALPFDNVGGVLLDRNGRAWLVTG